MPKLLQALFKHGNAALAVTKNSLIGTSHNTWNILQFNINSYYDILKAIGAVSCNIMRNSNEPRMPLL